MSKESLLQIWEYRELRRKLSEAISAGYVEEVPVMEKPLRFSLKKEWFRDKETGEIYYLIGPDGKSRGVGIRWILTISSGPGERIQ
jgi:hypothetical protein